MSINDLVSRNIRRIRSERQLSLGELARRAGLSKQTLSKIEQGMGNPTVDTLEAIGSALGASFRRLVTEWGMPVHIQRAADAVWERHVPGDSRHLDQIYGSGYVRTQVVVLEGPSRMKPVAAHAPGTLHQLYLIEGRVEAGAGQETFILGPGDFVRFPGDVDHGYRSLVDRSVAHLTTTAPQVPQFMPHQPGEEPPAES